MKWTCLDEPKLGNDDETFQLINKPYNWLIDQKWNNFVKIKFHSNEKIEWLTCNLNWA